MLVFNLDFFIDAEGGSPEEEAEKKLHNLGYCDEVMTVNISSFQRDYGHLHEPPLTETGEMDDATLEVLREVYRQCADDLKETNVSQ